MDQPKIELDAPGTYRIKVSGYLEPSWSGRLGGMAITTKSREGESLITTLYGELMDEAALAGVLSALYDLGYSLQSVKKIKTKEIQRV